MKAINTSNIKKKHLKKSEVEQLTVFNAVREFSTGIYFF